MINKIQQRGVRFPRSASDKDLNNSYDTQSRGKASINIPTEKHGLRVCLSPRRVAHGRALCSTVLAFVVATLLTATPGHAQQIIDDATEIVPGTRPNPWVIGGSLTIGNAGTGVLNIMADGAVSSSTSSVGNKTGANGTVTVSGNNATWTTTGSLSVGQNGSGTLNITDSGVVSTSYNGAIGAGSGSIGTVTVEGLGSSLTCDSQLHVGSYGNGTLNVRAGGFVSNTGGFVGSNSERSIGKVTVEGRGSAWVNSSFLHVGRDSTGALDIKDGGTVSAGSNSAAAGFDTGSDGTILVSGANSTLHSEGYLAIGLLGVGALIVEKGGAVSSTSGYVGSNVGSNGTATVDGAGSTWTTPLNFFVASAGTGSLTIRNGGVVSNYYGYVAINQNSSGSVTVDGIGATWINSGSLDIGRLGTVTLTVKNGSEVSATDVSVATNSTGQGIINIGSAQGESATAAGTLNTSTMTLGDRGRATLIFNHTDSHLFAPQITGTGTVNQIAGITVLTGANEYSGVTNVDGGTLQAGVMNTFSPHSAVTVASHATFALDGFSQTVASLSNVGTVTVGSDGTTPGTVLTVTGNYISNGGTLRLNTVLNKGSSDSQTDSLVANSAQLASTPTRIVVNNVGGAGAETEGDGILIIKVADLTSTAVAFELANSMVAGDYEYKLHQGDANGDNLQNWYLRSAKLGARGSISPVPTLNPVALLALTLTLPTLVFSQRRRGQGR